jgi:hypothetical protein
MEWKRKRSIREWTKPRATARAIVAVHSSFVGNRQSPGEDLSVKLRAARRGVAALPLELQEPLSYRTTQSSCRISGRTCGLLRWPVGQTCRKKRKTTMTSSERDGRAADPC